MLGTILTILKIIGIILLVLIGLIIFLLVLVLFVPIRYRLDVDIPEISDISGKNYKDISGFFKFSWLFHFINGGIEYPENFIFKIRIMCFEIFPRKKVEPSSYNEEERKASESDKDEALKLAEKLEKEANETSENITDNSDSANNISENKTKTEEINFEADNISSEEMDMSESEDSINDKENENIESAIEDDENNEPSFDEDDDDTDDADLEGFIDKICEIIYKIIEVIKIPQKVLIKIKCTISSIYDKITLVKNTIENPIFKRAYALVKKHIKKLLKIILPRKIDISISYGLDDPASTADIMAYYGMLYPWIGDKVNLNPYFDRKIVEGTVRIKGKVTIFGILYSVAVCYFNKDVKKVIKRFKKILKS
ncbi:MAG: hypothetical protein K6B41_06415 [Butyrivibrio sp.]|nr:hypothetical protein [Butyrivibrio sp.]